MVSWLEREPRELGDEASTSRDVMEALLRMEAERRKDIIGRACVWGSTIVCESDRKPAQQRLTAHNSAPARCSENFKRKKNNCVKIWGPM